MKFTVSGFQQQRLIEAGLKAEDALILRTLKDMYSSASMDFIIDHGEFYMWINFTYLHNQIPIVGSKRQLMRKIQKYCDENIIVKILRHEKDGVKGNYSYIRPTLEIDLLQDLDLMTNCHNPYDENGSTLMTNCHNKDSSIKDSSIRDNKYINIFDYWIKKSSDHPEALTKHNKLTNSMKKAIDRAYKSLGKEYDLTVLIDRFCECHAKSGKMKKRTLTEFFGQRSYQKDWLICEEFDDEGGLWLYWNNSQPAAQQSAIPGLAIPDIVVPDDFDDY